MSAQPILPAREIWRARARIAGRVCRTPLVAAPSLSALTGGEVLLKLETLQETGAFKLRGATNHLLALDPTRRARGVVTMSTGNHGRAVATAAARLGIRAVVCMSALVPENKVAAVRAAGGEARIIGTSQDEAAVEAARLVVEEGMTLVPPFDDPWVVAGQGTIGLELLEDAPDLDCVMVPLSGGGLAGGIALALKTADPAIEIVGLSTTRCPAMAASLEAGCPVEVPEEPSLADSLGGGIGLDNRLTFDLVRRHVDCVRLVGEEAIAAGMRHLFLEEGIVTEGAAAIGAAALLTDPAAFAGKRVAVVVSGRNVDMDAFRRIVGGTAA